MALTKADFLLTDEQLERINRHFADRYNAYAQAGEDPPGSMKVVFEWMFGHGRFVDAYFDGEIGGCNIEDPLAEE